MGYWMVSESSENGLEDRPGGRGGYNLQDGDQQQAMRHLALNGAESSLSLFAVLRCRIGRRFPSERKGQEWRIAG